MHNLLFFKAHTLWLDYWSFPSQTASLNAFQARRQVQKVWRERLPLRRKPQSRGFNPKDWLFTYDRHLTKVLLSTASEILQQQGNSAPRLSLVRAQNSRWTLAKHTDAKRVPTPMHQYQKCDARRKYRRERSQQITLMAYSCSRKALYRDWFLVLGRNH